MDAPLSLGSLDDMWKFYMCYHEDAKNRLVHMFTVPLLVWSALLLASYVRLPLLGISLGLVLAAGYAVYAAVLSTSLGLAFAPYAAVQFVLATLAYNFIPPVVAIPLAIIVHVLGWIAQLLGHAKLERNRPAFMTSLVHSLLAAPPIVYLETLFEFGLMSGTKQRFESSPIPE